MPWRLSLAPEALEDIDRHRGWLTQAGAGRKAHRTLSSMISAINELPAAPRRWPGSLDHPGYRTCVVAGYVIVYRLDPDGDDPSAEGDVLVLRVFAPKQDRRERV